MDQNVLVALLVVVIVVLAAWWYFFYRKQKCTASSDCKPGYVCTSGYCQKQASS